MLTMNHCSLLFWSLYYSIGGHGAFLMKMNNPNQYRSISALAPVCDLTTAPHSIEGLELYLGRKSNDNWDRWSAVNAAKCYKGPPFHILIDQVRKASLPTFFLKNKNLFWPAFFLENGLWLSSHLVLKTATT